jgi:uncharacterized protein (DUF488 family)
MSEKAVYTIGHSNHAFGHFLSLLRQHSITAVADVRSQPRSRYNPQFDRDLMSKSLRNAGVRYVFLGNELGARVTDPKLYRGDKVQYELVAKTDFFRAGIERILKGMETQRIVLLCAEKEPLACHRTILIGRHLRSLGLKVRHILDTGACEDHDASLMRLVQQLRISENHLFQSPAEIIETAYALQGERIAFSPKPMSRPA